MCIQHLGEGERFHSSGKSWVGKSWRFHIFNNTGNSSIITISFDVSYVFQDRWSCVNSKCDTLSVL